MNETNVIGDVSAHTKPLVQQQKTDDANVDHDPNGMTTLAMRWSPQSSLGMPGEPSGEERSTEDNEDPPKHRETLMTMTLANCSIS